MLGTIVNSIAIVLGSLIGILIKKGIPEKIKITIMQGIGLSVLLIGLTMALKTNNLLYVILSMVIGGVIGEILEIEDRLNKTGKWLEKRVGQSQSSFPKAFVTASLVYCVGAMAIMGALESGISGNHTILYAKSALDGITAIIFSSTLGIGVAFAAIPVFIYQGVITLGATSLSSLLNDFIINEMEAVGGLLIIGLGLNILNIKEIKVANLLPSILVIVLITLNS